MSSQGTLPQVIGIAIAALLLVPLVLMVVMMPVMGFAGWGHMWDGGMWGGASTGSGLGWLLSWLLMLVLLLGIGFVLYRTITRLEAETDPALEELRLAYARGDLTDEDFEERRTRLERDE